MKMTVNPEYALKAEISRWLCLICFIVQCCILFLVTHVYLPEGKSSNSVVFAVLVIPLLPFFPFLIVRHIKAHAWLMFTTLLYFLFVVLNVFDPAYNAFMAQLELGNIILLFTSSMLFTRYEQRRLGITITPKDGRL